MRCVFLDRLGHGLQIVCPAVLIEGVEVETRQVVVAEGVGGVIQVVQVVRVVVGVVILRVVGVGEVVGVAVVVGCQGMTTLPSVGGRLGCGVGLWGCGVGWW